MESSYVENVSMYITVLLYHGNDRYMIYAEKATDIPRRLPRYNMPSWTRYRRDLRLLEEDGIIFLIQKSSKIHNSAIWE
jgi:hypothetical protein